MQKSTYSKKFSLNWPDFLRGLFVAVITSVLYFIQTSLDAGEMKLEWKGLAISAVSGAVAYLIKNYFSSPPSTPKQE